MSIPKTEKTTVLILVIGYLSVFAIALFLLIRFFPQYVFQEFGQSERLPSEITAKIEQEEQTLKADQDMLADKKEQYRHVPIFEKDGVKYTVHEYLTPKGKRGYQIISFYEDYIKSVGYGPEAERRTFERKIIE